MKAPHVFDFIKPKCSSQDRFVSIAIGQQHRHNHPIGLRCMVSYGGVIICTRSGSTALNKIVNLSETCQERDADKYSYGHVNVMRYNKGKAPLGYLDWASGRLLPSHTQILKSIQSQMKGVQRSSFCMPPLDPSDS